MAVDIFVHCFKNRVEILLTAMVTILKSNFSALNIDYVLSSGTETKIGFGHGNGVKLNFCSWKTSNCQFEGFIRINYLFTDIKTTCNNSTYYLLDTWLV